MYCYAFLVYFVSENDDGHCVSNLALSRPKIHSWSVPVGELCGIAAGVRFVSMDMLNLLPQLKQDLQDNGVKIIVQTDSLCSASSLSPFKIHREVKFRNLTLATHRCGYEIVSLYPKVTIHFVHSQSSSVPADYCTRMSLQCVEYANSDFYRHGYELFRDKNWPSEENVFLKFSHGQEPQFSSPRSEQEVTDCQKCMFSDSFCYADTTLRSRFEPPSETSETTKTNVTQTGFLDEERYKKLLTNCGTLRKVIRVVSMILSLFRRSKHFYEEESYNIIIRSHQKYYKPAKNTSLYPFLDEMGLLRAKLRLTDEDATQLNVSSSPPIISHNDHRLTFLFINHAHCMNVFLGHPGHLNKTLTLAKLRQSPYPIHLTRASACVRKYIETCPICLRYLSKPSKIGLGSPRLIRYFKKHFYPFSIVSCDEIGPFSRRAFVNSRKNVSYWILIVACGLTGAISAELLEDHTRKSVLAALHLHSQRYTKPKVYVCDAGSSIHPQPKSALYQHFFGSHEMEVIRCQASHQALNFAENSVKKMKKLLRTALMTRKNINLPSMTYQDLRCVLESVCFIFNSQPIRTNEAEESFITPLHLMRLDYFEVSKHDNLMSPSAELFLSNLNIFRQSLGSALQTFHRILKMTLLSSTRRHLRMNPDSNPFRKDDIAVYIKITGYQLVRVLKTKPQFCFVFASDGKTKTVHCSLLCLVFRPESGCSSFTDQLQNDQDDDNNDNNVIIQPEEEMQQKCIFSHFISQRLGYHHDAGSECLLPASCPVTTCDTGPGPAWPGSDPARPGDRDEDWGKQTNMSGRQYDHTSGKHGTSKHEQVKLFWSPLIYPVRPSLVMEKHTL